MRIIIIIYILLYPLLTLVMVYPNIFGHEKQDQKRMYRCRAIPLRAILLIDDYRIDNIFHYQILELNILNVGIARSRPCFNPNTVVCVCKDRIVYYNVFHSILFWHCTNTSNAVIVSKLRDQN